MTTRRMRTPVRAAVAVAILLGMVGGLRAGPSAGAAPGDTPVFSDDFEDGVLTDSWNVVTAANGTAAVEDGAGVNGSRAAHIVVPDSTNSSIAYISRDLPADTYGVSVRGSFRVLSAGCNSDANYSNGNVPFIRLFDANDRRVVGLYRINGPNCGDNTKLYVQHSGGFYRVGVNIRFNTWYQFEVRASVAGPGTSLVQVYVNGSKRFETITANNGLLPFDHFNIHNEHVNQVGNLQVDNVEVATFTAGGPPANPCNASTPLPATSDPGTQQLADGFESFTFNQWSQIDQSGDGSASIATSPVHSGSCAARLHATSSTSSKANLQEHLPNGTTDVWADGWFNVVAEGGSGSNVPEFRIFSGSLRAIDVYRQNGGSGNMYLRLPTTGGTLFLPLNRTFPLGTWHEIKVHGVANATGPETIQVWIDGSLVHNSSSYELGVSSFSTVMVGSEHFAQAMELAADDIVIKRSP